MRLKALLWSLLLIAPHATGQAVSPFAGSEPLGEYHADFVLLHYLVPDGDGLATVASEGRLLSRLYSKPEDKSNLEVFRSFESALRSGGFEMVAVLDDVRRVELAAREANGPSGNGFIERSYTLDGRATGRATKALVATQAQQYMAARRTVDQRELLVVVSTSRSGNYVIEELEAAAMAEGSVSLTLDALREGMLTEGRIAIYGIYFATDSSAIQAESADALDTIVEYLTENPQRHFYVVGHTDDEGSLESNMALSAARAQAVVEAIVNAFPQARDRLTPRGVGPLSPVATNGQSDGRALNRRVELVSTHD